jgi:DNA-binding transcriptional LysR family regulator
MTQMQMQTFVTVVEQGSFTAAARVLGISQSGVSHALSDLEHELGVTLLERNRTGIFLTSTGESVLLKAREMLVLSEAIRQEVAAAKGLKTGVVRIGSFGVSSSLRLLPKLLQTFVQTYPNIEVVVQEGTDPEVLGWLDKRRVDVGFVTLPCDTFETTLIAEDSFVAIVPVHHILAKRNHIRVNELAAEPFIMSSCGCEALIENIFRTAKLQPRVQYLIRDISTIFALVAKGLGVSIVPTLSIPEHSEGVRVVPLMPKTPRQIALAVRREENASLATKALLELAKLKYSESKRSD